MRPIGRIEGWGHRTAGLGLQQKLDRCADDPYVLPHVRRAVARRLRPRRRHAGPTLDGIEVHDCFTVTEYLAIDHIGLTGPGEAWKAIENGEIEIGGRVADEPQRRPDRRRPPRRRHRRADGARRRQAGQRTAPASTRSTGATFATLNIGGSSTTTVSFVVGAAEEF